MSDAPEHIWSNDIKYIRADLVPQMPQPESWPEPLPPTDYDRGYQDGLRRGREMLMDDLRNGVMPEDESASETYTGPSLSPMA